MSSNGGSRNSVATSADASVGDVVARHAAKPERLVQILVELVERDGWISEDTIRSLAGALNLSRAKVHGVVSFYHDLRTSPPGRHVVRVCQAEACQAMGSRELTDHVADRLGLVMHRNNAEYSLEPVYCLGNCACAPAVMIDGKTYGRVDRKRFDALLDALRGAGS